MCAMMSNNLLAGRELRDCTWAVSSLSRSRAKILHLSSSNLPYPGHIIVWICLASMNDTELYSVRTSHAPLYWPGRSRHGRFEHSGVYVSFCSERAGSTTPTSCSLPPFPIINCNARSPPCHLGWMSMFAASAKRLLVGFDILAHIINASHTPKSAY